MGDGPRCVRMARLEAARLSAPVGWPTGKRVALSVNVMLEGWADGQAPGIGPMGNPLKPGVTDLQALSWAEYGPKVGAERLLDLLDREPLFLLPQLRARGHAWVGNHAADASGYRLLVRRGADA